MKTLANTIKFVFSIIFLFQFVGCSNMAKKENPNTRSYILTKPEQVESKGTILLIHGSAPFNIDGRVPVKSESLYSKITFYKDLAEQLNILGWAVVCYAKPGVHQGHVDFDVYKTTDLSVISKQINTIWKELPDDRPKIVFAWSEGSLHVTPLLLSEARGVILLGGISTNIKDVILSQADSESERQKIELELKGVSSMPRDKMLGIDRPAGRLIDEFNLSANWLKFKSHPKLPILILHGNRDKEVPFSQARLWKEKLPKHNITLKVKESGNHVFAKGTSSDPVGLAETISKWLDREVKLDKPVAINKEGVFNIPVILPKSLESQRSFFEQTILSAQKRLLGFAKKHGWGHLAKESFADRVEIFNDKASFDRRVLELTGADTNMKLPKTYSAVLEKRVLIAVSPQLYETNYPEGVEDDSFKKLLCHEMIHRLHIRILNGDEEAMGPIWFFEGFAILGSNQFEKNGKSLKQNEVWDIVKSKKRGDYRKYGATIRYWTKKIPLADLVARAGRDNFSEWLKQKR